ncbi:hypothetical protein [Pseudomonas savastanoi]|uniref:hypothetical protein n=2 Tax=Pseudomonas savastanoi TaxID=29438 RepID=UPI0009B6D36C|nr:hypothetical protein [Pseudomonas savastanoi]MBN3471722.1 hypothetical protein [Pseudomonas savastanoi pv. phaseolicola]MBN3478648.1 hypothetical protein [Pseudomonas savastanoi pv. phaseolicola]MCQ3008434.1 hypothetical protein [Pseudomonas savastanoi]PYD15645.1 hypothetical protein DND36_29210 [Pseudomonas savastanoi pv. glycinea]
MLKILPKNNNFTLFATMVFGIFFFSAISTSTYAEDLGVVSAFGDVKPANPTNQQVWNSHWSQAYDNCRKQFDNAHSVVLDSWEVTAGGRQSDHWQINSVWTCRS